MGNHAFVPFAHTPRSQFYLMEHSYNQNLIVSMAMVVLNPDFKKKNQIKKLELIKWPTLQK